MVFKNNKPFLILGTPGLDVQIQAMTQLFLNIIEFGMNPQEAIESPRFASYSFPLTSMINNYEPGVLSCENDIKENVIKVFDPNISNFGDIKLLLFIFLILIIFTHKNNISNLINRTEHKIKL